MATSNQILEKKKIYTPKLYKVILYNDDITTMDFVIQILVDIFNKSIIQATQTMMKIHNEGSEVCGVYIQEIAKTKQNQVLKMARNSNFPLKCTIEKE